MKSNKISKSNKQINDGGAPPLRLYQVWKGNNEFALGGRLIFGPDARSLYLTIFLIVAPVILFYVFVSPSLMNHFAQHLGYLIVAIPAAFLANILILIILISGCDPGIIPRNTQSYEIDDESDTSSVSTDRAPYLPPTKSVCVNGMVIRVKFCQTCMLYRPPRCSHCAICNNCVERFDHHCPWVGQCIGKRNYQYFFMFVSSATLLSLYVFAFSWVNVIMIMESNHCNLWKALIESPVSVMLISYTFTSSWFVGGLSAFHLYLVLTNQTTYENFRYRYDKRMNPYNQGCAHNFKEILLSKIPRSKINLRAVVKARSTSCDSGSRYLGRGVSTINTAAKTNLKMETGKHAAADRNKIEDVPSETKA